MYFLLSSLTGFGNLDIYTAMNELELVEYNGIWKKIYEKESSHLKNLLKTNLVETFHIGSTAIPSIVARPTMDILCSVHTLDGIEVFKSNFESLGYTWKQDGGLPNSIQFIRYAPDKKTELTNIRIFEQTNILISDILDFRDYLNAEDEVAKEYQNIKLGLKEEFKKNPMVYEAAKAKFFQIVLKNLR
jgi:GrpB-like predicted nucleotidyltransferase (UPF0157 family)